MKDELITFETAKLAKEKGFDVNTQAGYFIKAKDKGKKNKIFHAKDSHELDSLTYINDEYQDNVYFVMSSPTQSLLQRWLREKHNLLVWITPVKHSGMSWRHNNSTETAKELFSTYELALEVGLVDALKYIKS